MRKGFNQNDTGLKYGNKRYIRIGSGAESRTGLGWIQGWIRAESGIRIKVGSWLTHGWIRVGSRFGKIGTFG